jgi:hypothetical protein
MLFCALLQIFGAIEGEEPVGFPAAGSAATANVNFIHNH